MHCIAILTTALLLSGCASVPPRTERLDAVDKHGKREVIELYLPPVKYSE